MESEPGKKERLPSSAKGVPKNAEFYADYNSEDNIEKKWANKFFSSSGYATFLLKCHALCPICLTSFVVHFCAHIFVVILNLCSFPSAGIVSGKSPADGRKIGPNFCLITKRIIAAGKGGKIVVENGNFVINLTFYLIVIDMAVTR